MKKSLLFFIVCFVFQSARSQWINAANGNDIYYSNSGNVGIHTTSPWSALDIRTNGSAGTGYYGINLQNPSTIAWSTINFNMTSGVGSSSVITSQRDNLTNGTNLVIQSTDVSGALQTRMVMWDNGNIGIGTGTPTSSRLAVEGTISARKVIVTQTNPFPDYVFAPGYQLPSLISVDQYIKLNHHLPGMPSAAEVAKNGLELGNTQGQLLEKIEQLTLYTIELQRQVSSLRTANEKFINLQQQIDELKKALSKN